MSDQDRAAPFLRPPADPPTSPGLARITLVIDPSLLPLELHLRLGDGGQVRTSAVPAAAPPAAVPPKPATAQEMARYYPTAPDEGQHDHYKAEMCAFLWRALVGDPEARARRDQFGMAWNQTTTHIATGPIFPMGRDLCQASLRLGFRRLACAALGLEGPRKADGSAHGEVSPPQFPVGGAWLTAPHDAVDLDDFLNAVMTQHADAVEQTVQNALDAHQVAAKKAKELSVPPPAPPDPKDIHALMDLGAYERPDLDNCPALLPWRVQAA